MAYRYAKTTQMASRSKKRRANKPKRKTPRRR